MNVFLKLFYSYYVQTYCSFIDFKLKMKSCLVSIQSCPPSLLYSEYILSFNSVFIVQI